MPYFYLKKRPMKSITLDLPHRPRISRAPDTTPGSKISLETLQFSSVQSSSVQLFNYIMRQETPRSTSKHQMTLRSAGERQKTKGTPASHQLALFCHTKQSSKRKCFKLSQKNANRQKNLANYPCFATQNTPRNQKCPILT